MSKTIKEKTIEDQTMQIELIQRTSQILIDKINSVTSALILTTPLNNGFGDEQKWTSIWDDHELQDIKDKVLILIRDL